MPQIVKPRKLTPNATIGIISPASPMVPEKLEMGVRYLENLGYRVEIGKAVHKTDGYLAGSDEERIADLEQMFARKDIDAIFCSRGGYGTPRLLHKINYDLIRQNPKIFVGYSDLTALQLAIFAKTGLVTFSGPMVAVELANGIKPQTEDNFWRTITSAEPLGTLRPLLNNLTALNRHNGVGPILPGCLSVIAGIAGTEFFPRQEGCVLLFEDVGENPYRIDHYLAQLQNAGVLAGLGGAIAGQFSDCLPSDDTPSWTIDEILRDYFADASYPTITGFDYGHDSIKYTIPVGVPVRLKTDPIAVEITESAVLE